MKGKNKLGQAKNIFTQKTTRSHVNFLDLFLPSLYNILVQGGSFSFQFQLAVFGIKSSNHKFQHSSPICGRGRKIANMHIKNCQFFESRWGQQHFNWRYQNFFLISIFLEWNTFYPQLPLEYKKQVILSQKKKEWAHLKSTMLL